MPELPPDPDRLRAILAWLDERHVENETVGIYLRMQRDAVREALARAEGGSPADPKSPPAEPERPRGRKNTRSSGGGQPRPLPTFTAPASGGRGSTGFTVEQRAQAMGAERVLIHVDDCPHAGEAQPIDPHGARASLLEGMEACPFCRPDGELGIETD
ncbi:DUF6233 domain-containing protein [Streptomyces sp. NPDC046900]|uniref:DUF6233 domain-containing protein n=1 Tax=Streptomyces sp. NPDC046900 TaxID=3155473 RepID=UPI0033C92767